jgi:hypothetical protein
MRISTRVGVGEVLRIFLTWWTWFCCVAALPGVVVGGTGYLSAVSQEQGYVGACNGVQISDSNTCSRSKPKA